MPNNQTPATPPIQNNVNDASSVISGYSTRVVTIDGQTYSIVVAADGQVVSQIPITLGKTTAADTYVYGVHHPFESSTYEFHPDNPPEFPDPHLLVDNRERTLTSLSEYTGRSTITVVGGSQNNRIFQTIEFFVTGLQIEQTEAYSIQKNALGFTFYSFDSNPASLSISGMFLNGKDFSTRAATRSSLRNKILDTNWFNRFLSEYKEVFNSSKAIENDLRVFFAVENITFEVFIVGYSTGVESTMPTLPSFRLNMIVKKMIPRNVKDEDLNLLERKLLSITLKDTRTGDITSINLAEVQIDNTPQNSSDFSDFSFGELPPGNITTNGGTTAEMVTSNGNLISSLNTSVKS